MVWKCNMDERREDTQKMQHLKMEGEDQEQNPEADEQTKLEDIQKLKVKTKKKVQENRTWKNKDGWTFLCNSISISLETT